MRRAKNLAKAVAMVCVLAVCVCALPPTAVWAEEEDLEAKVARLQSVVDEISSNIAALDSTINNAEYQKQLYKQQQQAIEELLAANQENIATSQTVIAQKQLEVATKMESILASQALFEERMVAMYKQKNENMLATLLSVNSFSELLTISTSLQRITQHDTDLLQTLQREKEELEQERQELELLVEDLNQKNEDHQTGIEMLAGSIAAQDQTITQAQAKQEAEEAVFGDAYEDLERAKEELAHQEAVKAQIAAEAAEAERLRQEEADRRRQEEEERNRQQAEQNEGGEGEEGEDGGEPAPVPDPTPEPPVHNGSVYVWPVPGHYNVTCEYGQPDPNGIGHRGMDINDGSINGAGVVAAGSGTVLRAGWDNSYGNYVSIDHGGGVVSLYAHMSSFNVYVGQYVEANTTIGAVGNTGFVVGANGGYHLHFEVMVNGATQNPRNYVSA